MREKASKSASRTLSNRLSKSASKRLSRGESELNLDRGLKAFLKLRSANLEWSPVSFMKAGFVH